MKQVIVGSENPVKLEATKEAFALAFADEDFTYEAIAVASGVPDQPFGEEETKLGAKNRSDACKKERKEAAYFVGHEGGLIVIDNEMWAFAWMCVQSKEDRYGFGRTGSFVLPPEVSDLIHKGEELGVATDIVFKKTNSKHSGATIGALTDEKISRKDFYLEAMIFALIPFMKPELYR